MTHHARLGEQPAAFLRAASFLTRGGLAKCGKQKKEKERAPNHAAFPHRVSGCRTAALFCWNVYSLLARQDEAQFVPLPSPRWRGRYPSDALICGLASPRSA